MTRHQKQNGFTLIELLVVTVIIGLMSSVAMYSFSSYRDSQTLNSAASDLTTLLQSAKSKSLSQSKPASCTNFSLNGYRVTITASSYQLDAICNGTAYLQENKQFPTSVSASFSSGTSVSFTFQVITGGVTGASGTGTTITLTLQGGSTKVVRVYSDGRIVIN